MKQFMLTSTNPAVLTLSTYSSNKFEEMLDCASRFAIGESNCDGCIHWYAITNTDTGLSVLYQAYELIHNDALRYPWACGELRQSALVEAATAMQCTVDELLYPREEA